jgi:type I restriction-modification system DNA methylase subunit
MTNHREIVSFIWSVADLIRDTFKRGKYQDVILPLTVLRRIDCVLEPTKPQVLERHAQLSGKLDNLDPQLRKLEARLDGDLALSSSVKVNRAASARLTFDHVAGDKVQDMIDSSFKFYKQITDDQAFARALFDLIPCLCYPL